MLHKLVFVTLIILHLLHDKAEEKKSRKTREVKNYCYASANNH